MLRKSVPDRGFTLVELLVVIAIISILAGFLIPTIMSARGRASLVQCQNNLREINKLGMLYADGAGTRFYPIAKGTSPPAHESLNAMIKYHGEMKPSLFVCPTWKGDTAEPVDGKFTLEESSCAYTWPKRKVSTSDSSTTPISCDKYVKSEDLGGHDKGRNVVYLDTSVDFVSVEKLPAEELPKNLTY